MQISLQFVENVQIQTLPCPFVGCINYHNNYKQTQNKQTNKSQNTTNKQTNKTILVGVILLMSASISEWEGPRTNSFDMLSFLAVCDW